MKSQVPQCLLVVVIFVTVSWSSPPSYRRICYYTNWSQYRPGVRRFTTDNITDPSLCTHLMYSFAKIVPEDNTIGPYEWNDEGPSGYYKKFTEIKKRNPNLKVLLAVGGWSHGSEGFVDVVSSDERIDSFRKNVYDYLTSRNFDGIDIDWEYPAHRGSNSTDKQRFTVWIKAMRNYFELQANKTGKPRLLLTAALAASRHIFLEAYEISKISQYLDFMSLMTFDFYGGSSKFLNHHSVTFGRTDEQTPNSYYNTDYVVKYFRSEGVPRDKIVISVPLYGRAFRLINSTLVEMGDPNNGSVDVMPYNQMCKLGESGWTVKWHPEHRAPYAYSDTAWVGYDDLRSVEIKANYIKDNHLGGFMAWALDFDDFGGVFCGVDEYPMLNKLKRVLTSSRDKCEQGSWGKVDEHGCYKCAVGTYQPGESMTSCQQCPANKVTYSSGAESLDQCIPQCAAGQEYDSVKSSCVNCPLHYYRRDVTDGYCRKCNESSTTMSSGSVQCVPVPEGMDTPKPERITMVLKAQFHVKSCENSPVVWGAITNGVTTRLQKLSQTLPQVCHKDCSNVRVSRVTGCGSRIKRAAEQTINVIADITIENIPIEMETAGMTRTSESILTETFLNKLSFSQLEAYGISYNGVRSKHVSCVRLGYEFADSICYPCPHGSFVNETMTSCESCPVGSYQDQSAQTSCRLCPSPLTTAVSGSHSSKECVSPCIADVNYCLNRGICQFDKIKIKVRCRCQESFYGDRCQHFQRRPLNQAVIVGSTIGGAVVFLTILIIIVVCVSYRRYHSDDVKLYQRSATLEKKPITV